jgi:regulator of sigma E protease
LSGVISAIIILLILGVLITVHELGHYLAARLCGVRVREFAIGMGPAFFKRQKTDENGEPTGTKFSLRVFPVGGFCDMGEDEESDDPSHFRNKKNWQKVFVLISGSVMNFLMGFLFFLILYLSVNYIAMPDVINVEPEFPYADQIQVGDRFYSINGHRIYSYMDFRLFLDRDTEKPYTFVLERNGERFTVEGATRQVDGGTRFGFSVLDYEELTPSRSLWHAATSSVSFVRMVWITLGDLIFGKAGAGDLMGPVGMGGVVNDIISEENADAGDIALTLLQLAGLVAVNLAVVNMLPIPALDGGRILFLFISAFLMLVRKKPLNSKIEGYIHGVTMILLFALMILIFYNDIMRLIGL